MALVVSFGLSLACAAGDDLSVGVVINEICYDSTTVNDGTGRYASDWLELYNNSGDYVPIGGMSIGKKKSYENCGEALCVLPQYTMDPGEFLVVFFNKDLPEAVNWYPRTVNGREKLVPWIRFGAFNLGTSDNFELSGFEGRCVKVQDDVRLFSNNGAHTRLSNYKGDEIATEVGADWDKDGELVALLGTDVTYGYVRDGDCSPSADYSGGLHVLDKATPWASNLTEDYRPPALPNDGPLPYPDPETRPPVALRDLSTGRILSEGDVIELTIGETLMLDVVAEPGRTLKVKGLPSGLKFKRSGLWNAGGIAGTAKAATRPGRGLVTVTANGTKPRRTDTFTFTVKVNPLPAWMVGKYSGTAAVDGVAGTVALTVAKSGKLTGTAKVGGKSRAVSAKSYAVREVTDDGEAYVYSATLKVGAERREMRFAIRSVPFGDGAELGSAATAEGARDTLEAVQNPWSRADRAALRLPTFASGTTVTYPTSRGPVAMRFGVKGKVTATATLDGRKTSAVMQLVLLSRGAPCGEGAADFTGAVPVVLPKAGFAETVPVAILPSADPHDASTVVLGGCGAD